MEPKRKSAYNIQAPESILREAFRSAVDETIERRTDIALKILFPDCDYCCQTHSAEKGERR